MDRNQTFEQGPAKIESKRKKRAAQLVASLAVAGAAFGVAGCQEPDTQAHPTETTSPSTSETSEPTTPTPTETTAESTEVPSVDGETLPNGEAVLTPSELIDLREQGGDEAVIEYFTPTLDKIGMTKDEAYADPTEFGNNVNHLFSAYSELVFNIPLGMAGDIKGQGKEDIVAQAESWLPLTYNYRSKVDSIADVLKYAADIQDTAVNGSSESVVTWNVEPVSASTTTRLDIFDISLEQHTTNDSILYDYIGQYGDAYDEVSTNNRYVKIQDDGTLSIEN